MGDGGLAQWRGEAPGAGKRVTFEIIPAIDIRGGRCVRLFQGDYAQETIYGDPIEMARKWESLGAPRLHVVDLDGAKERRPVNHELVLKICRAVSIPVEVSGGVRSMETVQMWRDAGVERVQIGSAAIENPAFVRDAIASHGDHIVVSIDCRGGEVMTNGWLEGSGVQVLDLARVMVEAGVARVMVTDISQDGGMLGPNLALYEQLVAELSVPVVASGGVGAYGHLVALAGLGCEGVIVGKALYEGAIDLPAAIAAVSSAAG